jgi:hypothetical protein
MIDRQKLIGWILLLWSGGYIVYLLKARILVSGPPIERREWIYFFMSLGGLVLGSINVRMAAARARGQKFYKPDWLAPTPRPSSNDNDRSKSKKKKNKP